MRHGWIVCCFVGLLGLSGPALARVSAEPILVNQGPGQKCESIRVGFRNDGDSVETLSAVELQARQGPSGVWKVIRVWNRPLAVGPHALLNLDYRPRATSLAKATLSLKDYELRVFATTVDGERITANAEFYDSAGR